MFFCKLSPFAFLAVLLLCLPTFSSLVAEEITPTKQVAFEFWDLDPQEELTELDEKTFLAAAPVVGVAALPLIIRSAKSLAAALGPHTVKVIVLGGALIAIVTSHTHLLSSDVGLLTQDQLSHGEPPSPAYVAEKLIETYKKIKQRGGPEGEKKLLAELHKEWETSNYNSHFAFLYQAIRETEKRQSYYVHTGSWVGWKELLEKDLLKAQEMLESNPNNEYHILLEELKKKQALDSKQNSSSF